MLDGLSQIGDGLLVFAIPDIVVGQGSVPVVLGSVVDGVAALVAYDVLGIVEPVQFYIAASQPGTGYGILQGLGLIEARHITEGGGGLLELAFLKLCLAHQQPCFPEERVVFATGQPFLVLDCLAAALPPFGLGLDAMHFDGLLHLLHRAVEVALAQRAALFVANGIEWQYLGVVVLVAFFFLQGTVDIGLRAVEVGVISGGKRLPGAADTCVFVCRTSGHQHTGGHYI